MRGVTLVTYVRNDPALEWYEWAGLRGLGKSLGTTGARLPDTRGQSSDMGDAGAAYTWAPGVVNIDAHQHIVPRDGVQWAAHIDLMHPPVMHAFWTAIGMAGGGGATARPAP